MTTGNFYRFNIQTGGVEVGPIATDAPGNLFGLCVKGEITAAAAVPGAPTIGTATAGNAQATVSWTAPGDDGGSPVTGYTVTPCVGATAQTAQVFASTATTQTITGLTNGTTYTFTVMATNASGDSPESAASNAVTPQAPPPAVVVKFGSAMTKAVVEGNSGTTAVSANVNLSAASALPVTVFWSTVNGTASFKDYVGAFGWVTFAPGETRKTVTVQINGELKREANEVFTLNLSAPVNALLGIAVKPIQITNDD